MSMLMMLKEGGTLVIDTIGNKPIDEDIDLLAETTFPATIGLATMGVSTLGTNVTVVGGTES